MYDATYLNFTNISDTCERLMSYLKYNSDITKSIYIVSDQISEEDAYILKCIYPVTFITANDKKKNKKILNLSDTDNNSSVDTKKVCIFYYVYYTEFIAEGLNYINKFNNETIDMEVNLYIYTFNDPELQFIKTKTSQLLSPTIKCWFEVVENRGRDIRPFLCFIKNNHWRDSQYICKLHTKKTTYLDKNWRSNYFKYLLLDDVRDNLERLNNNSPIILPGKYNIQEIFNSRNVNFKKLNKLIEVMSLKQTKLINNVPFKFNAGTMFWCNNTFIKNIYSKLSDEVINLFEPEPIAEDGTYAHAWERLISNIYDH